MTSLGRLIFFDQPGPGASDPVTPSPTLEQWADSITAVLDDLGSSEAVLLAVAGALAPAALFAATYPSRTTALVVLLTVEYPTGSGINVTLDKVAADLWKRLASIFLVGPEGSRPCFGGVSKLQTDARWRTSVLFFEYFHGDHGAGLGASHQTGWTGLVADVIRRRHRAYPSVSQVIQRLVASEEKNS